jgi:hypothetical protein
MTRFGRRWKRRGHDTDMSAIFGLLLFVGFVIHYFWWITAAAAIAFGWYKWRVFQLACEMHETAEARRRNAVRARADQQQAWTLAGDDRGIYGAYTPAAV